MEKVVLANYLCNELGMDTISAGSTSGQVVRLEQMLPLYYRARGWDEAGRPEPRKLSELNL